MIRFKWMRYFFSENASPGNLTIIELQRRAVWIALAFILQALNEVDHDWYIPYLMPFGSLIPLLLMLGSFFALGMAFRPVRHQAQDVQHPSRWQYRVLVVTMLLALIGCIVLGWSVAFSLLPPRFSNDGTSLDTNAAIQLLQGRNPYTNSDMVALMQRFHIEPDWTTPLRLGQFANRLDYPTIDELQTVYEHDLKTGTDPEFESKVSYPALSFLTLVPFVLFKHYNVLPFYILSYLALVAIAWRVVRPELRPWALLLAMANIPMWSSAIGGNLDIFYTLLIVLVWLQRNHRWSSAIFLGLALATKQIAWFFTPFYIILVFRNYGLKECIYRMFIASSLAVTINLPFILWDPHAWIAGVLAPIADPMFPMGVGIINLSVTHLLPFFPSWVYSALEGACMLFSLVWYWRVCREHPEAAMLLAVLPLFFTWRSLPSYFYCVAYPVFIVMAAKTQSDARHRLSSTANLSESAHIAASA